MSAEQGKDYDPEEEKLKKIEQEVEKELDEKNITDERIRLSLKENLIKNKLRFLESQKRLDENNRNLGQEKQRVDQEIGEKVGQAFDFLRKFRSKNKH